VKLGGSVATPDQYRYENHLLHIKFNNSIDGILVELDLNS
jgi:hypothetical protein